MTKVSKLWKRTAGLLSCVIRAASLEQLPARSVALGWEQKIQNVPQQIKPHLEVLPPYVPDK